jgi:2-polyprenyl-3-methyl-5-hydroxy-6-metoxy-1,4-benzoquinol methylase
MHQNRVMAVVDPEGAELAALDEVVDLAGLRVLDVGCGDGRLVWPVAQRAAFVLGTDPDDEAVESARAAVPDGLSGRVGFRVCDVVDLDEPAGSFDAAFLTWSL